LQHLNFCDFTLWMWSGTPGLLHLPFELPTRGSD